MLNPNEAPEGFWAELYHGSYEDQCELCDLEFNDECFNWGCRSEDRDDRCNVIFIKALEGTTAPKDVPRGAWGLFRD